MNEVVRLREFGTIQCQENSKGGKVACVEADCLCR